MRCTRRFSSLCIWTETLLLVVLNSLLAAQPEQLLSWLVGLSSAARPV